MSVTEIARLAGVSVATVSRVINNYPDVSPENVRRVNAAMSDLEYVAQPRGRGGRRSELDCVALLMSSNHMFDIYASTGHGCLRAIEDSLRDRHLGMIVSYVSGASDIPESVLRGKVRGVILMGHYPHQELVEKLKHMPHVWVNSYRSKSGDVVLAGNQSIGRLAAEHLHKRGHRRVGALNRLPDAAALARVRSFRFESQELGMAVSVYQNETDDPKLRADDVDLGWFESNVAALADQMLQSAERPTGLLVPSDFQAAMLYRVLAKRGVRPGFDIEIMGTDAEKGALMGLYPRPTTVNLGMQAIGRRAVDHLMMRIANPEYECVQVVLEPEIVLGDEVKQNWSAE